ncbi:MAG: GNAT family N-acetyltransferase [Acidobacteriota bacterium]
MPKAAFGSKPSVLRCSRCGKFVDWEDARLQIVCGCRAHVELPSVDVREATDDDRSGIVTLFKTDLGRSKFVAFGVEVQADRATAIVAQMEGALAGALAYQVQGDTLQIVALATDPEWQRSGVGARLVDHAEQVAREQGAAFVAVNTTNDNLPALYFYQRRGYRLTQVNTDVIGAASGEPGLVGFGGIPVRDEFHLVKAIPPRFDPA